MQTCDVTSEALQIIQRSLYCKNMELYRHSLLAADIARFVATECRLVFNYSPDDAYIAGMLHDVGKLCVPSEILEKRESLTSREWEVIKRHPVWGYEYVQGTVFEQYGNAILYHHEKPDGTGYPLTVKVCNYCNDVRLVALADQMAAFLDNRPYRRRVTHFGLVCREIRQVVSSLFGGVEAASIIVALRAFTVKWLNDSRNERHAFAPVAAVLTSCLHPSLEKGCGLGDCQLTGDISLPQGMVVTGSVAANA